MEKNISLEKINDLYLKLSYEYLLHNTDIKKIDDLLYECKEYNIPAIEDKNKDFYQNIASNYLKYFYIRNDLNINNLDENEKKYLEELLSKGTIVYNDEINNFIKNTIKKVYSKYEINNANKKFYVWYGPIESSYYMVDNETLAIGFRYYEYVEYDLNDFDNQMKYLDRNEFINFQCENLEENLTKNLGLEVKVLQYNDEVINMLNGKKTI